MINEKSVFKALVNNEKGIFRSLNDLSDLGKRFFVCSVHLFLQEEDISKNRKSERMKEVSMKKLPLLHPFLFLEISDISIPIMNLLITNQLVC